MKRKNNIWISLFILLIVGTGCSNNGELLAIEPELSDEPIAFEVDGWQPMTESRTTLFGESNFFDETKEGGNFTLYAHITGTDNTYISGTRVWCRPADKQWFFRSGEDLITYYWPNNGALNFFAYMPYKDYSGGKNHYVSNIQYSKANGQTFSCALPNTNGTVTNNIVTETDDVEFIYAYAENLSKQNVNLSFKHPFALIQFKLATGSYRMTVKEITLGGVDLQGTFSTLKNGSWTSSNDNTGYTAYIYKRIPSDAANYNTVFGGPFLMMPQSLDGVTLTLVAERTEGNTPIEKSVNLSGTSWQPGKIYTYTLLYGDNNEEIYYNVAVELWEIESYRNDVDVE